MTGWNKEEEFILVNLYERFPLLWNLEDLNYYNLVKRHQAWREIATNLDKSVEGVQKKIRSVKNLYRWEKAQMKKPGETEEDQGQNHNNASTRSAFGKFEFSTNEYKPKKQCGSEKIDTASEHKVTDYEDDDIIYENIGKTPDNPILVNKIHNGSLISTTRKKQTPSGNTSMNSNTESPKTSLMEDPATVSCHKMFKNTLGVSMRDACDHFGSYVAAKLRGFDRHTRAQLEFRITSVLVSNELGHCKPSAFSDSSAASSLSSLPPRRLMYTPSPPSSTPMCTGPQPSHSFHRENLIFSGDSVSYSPPEFLTFSDVVCVTQSGSMNAPTCSAVSPFNRNCGSFEDSPSILIIDSD